MTAILVWHLVDNGWKDPANKTKANTSFNMAFWTKNIIKEPQDQINYGFVLRYRSTAGTKVTKFLTNDWLLLEIYIYSPQSNKQLKKVCDLGLQMYNTLYNVRNLDDLTLIIYIGWRNLA